MVGTGLIFIWNMVIKSAGAWASAILLQVLAKMFKEQKQVIKC